MKTKSHLKKAGIKNLTIANRTLEHAQELAFQKGTQAIRLQDIEELCERHQQHLLFFPCHC